MNIYEVIQRAKNVINQFLGTIDAKKPPVGQKEEFFIAIPCGIEEVIRDALANPLIINDKNKVSDAHAGIIT